jgi:hypothetical protein
MAGIDWDEGRTFRRIADEHVAPANRLLNPAMPINVFAPGRTRTKTGGALAKKKIENGLRRHLPPLTPEQIREKRGPGAAVGDRFKGTRTQGTFFMMTRCSDASSGPTAMIEIS